jgi:hypothetical protein
MGEWYADLDADVEGDVRVVGLDDNGRRSIYCDSFMGAGIIG